MTKDGEGVIGRARRQLALLAVLVVASATLVSVGQITAAPATITVDAATTVGTFNTALYTQMHYPRMLDQAAGTRSLFRSLGSPLVRILASSDGCCWAGGPAPMIPAGKVKGSWDFSSLDSVVNDVVAAGGQSVFDIFQAPEWMWDCTTGAIRDLTFSEFGDYMARLVGYYNTGSFVAEDGRTITNPAGVSNRITYWELWNEPDLWSIACAPNGNPNITAAQYTTMWNAAVPKMLAVDPTIKFIGPVAGPSGNASGNYYTTLLSGANRKPDFLSFHGYGGFTNTATDQAVFDGIDGIVGALNQVRGWAPTIPVWITEINAQAAWAEDTTRRPVNAYSAAWGASAFRRLALNGAAALYQYEFVHPNNPNFQMVEPSLGQARLPFWRDYYLARYFPSGSTLLSASSSPAGVETLAARAPGSNNVHVLVVNRQVESATIVGGVGVPTDVQVSVANLTGVTQVILRQLDAATPLATGPAATALPVGTTATVNFAGYGAALLDFVTSSPPVPTALPPPPPPTSFADDFESKNLFKWSSTSGAGSAATQATVVHAGTSALSLSNAAGQAVWLTKDLGQAFPSSSTSFWLRPTSTTAGFVAFGRDASSTKVRWALYYNPVGHAVSYLVYNDAGVGSELASAVDTVPLDTWTQVELRYIGTSTGGAELLLGGVSKASVTGNYASTSPYRLLQLANETPASTTYFDDVLVR